MTFGIIWTLFPKGASSVTDQQILLCRFYLVGEGGMKRDFPLNM